MELNLSATVRQIITALLLLILPLLAILLGVVFNILNAWYFILCVTWFAVGIIFYGAISQ
jgi:Na+-translocating ferredoxin:NAD+ oxidoreductase RnfD subunit